jgi:hypothetical protein
MAEVLKVTIKGEEVILTVEGEAGRCVVRMNSEEAEHFEEVFHRVRKKVGSRAEGRKSHEAIRVDRVDDDEDFEEAE